MAGTDVSIYSNLLRPPKSVAEYDAEALSNQQNRLALQMSQAQLGDRQRAIDEGNKLRQVVSGFGADKSANANALLSAGLLDKAQSYQKSNADIEKASTDVEKTKQETLKMQKESAAHQFEIAGQLASAWSTNTAITKAQIQAGLNAAAHSGVISPEITQAKMTELESLPDNPMALNGWAKGTLQQVMKAKDSMSYLAPDANTVANNDTSRLNNKDNNARIAAEGTANRGNAIKVQQMITDRQPEPISGTKLAPEDIATMAQQYLAGDKSVLQGLGRGMQGAEDIRAVRAEIGKQLRGSGLTGADQAAKIAEYGGLVTGLRATGNISARVENAIAEAEQLAPLAISAGREVSRSGILPFGKAQIMFDTNTNNPALSKFAAANQGLVTAYASAMARGNKPTVSDNEHARELLTTAKSQEAYEATVAQMKEEMKAASAAPRSVRANLSAEISGKGGHGSAPPAAAIPSGWSVKEH